MNSDNIFQNLLFSMLNGIALYSEFYVIET